MRLIKPERFSQLQSNYALEALADAHVLRGPFAIGYMPTLADLYLVSKVRSAHRFNVDLAR